MLVERGALRAAPEPRGGRGPTFGLARQWGAECSPPATVLTEYGKNENRVADGLKPECGARHWLPQIANRFAKRTTFPIITVFGKIFHKKIRVPCEFLKVKRLAVVDSHLSKQFVI